MHNNTILRVAVAGGGGQMGRVLLGLIHAAPDLEIAGASEAQGSQLFGKSLREVLPAAPDVTFSDPVTAAADADVWIDFTVPAATVAALQALKATRVRAAIIGTTGFDEAGESTIIQASSSLAIVRSGNFSLGVNLLAGLVRQAAAKLGDDWDIEITEAHHRRKIDAPSGTALMLGEAAASGRGKALEAVRLAPHDGITGGRTAGGIGFSVVRGGGIIGAHDVLFAAEDEQITLSHRAGSRSLFARGALHAARWACTQPTGLYSMQDVLGLE